MDRLVNIHLHSERMASIWHFGIAAFEFSSGHTCMSTRSYSGRRRVPSPPDLSAGPPAQRGFPSDGLLLIVNRRRIGNCNRTSPWHTL